MRTTTRRLSDEQQAQRRAQQHELVTASIKQLRSSDGWQRYLCTRAALRSYSPRNVLLIMLQPPHRHPRGGLPSLAEARLRRPERRVRDSDLGAMPTQQTRQLQGWRDAAPT
jgi:hypothetical protein